MKELLKWLQEEVEVMVRAGVGPGDAKFSFFKQELERRATGLTTKSTNLLSSLLEDLEANWTGLTVYDMLDAHEQDLVNRVSRVVASQLTLSKVNKALLSKPVRAYKTSVETIFITEYSRQENIKAVERLEKQGQTQYRFLATPSERTCDVCGAKDGKLFSIDDDANRPPLHPRCRCTVVTATLSQEELDSYGRWVDKSYKDKFAKASKDYLD